MQDAIAERLVENMTENILAGSINYRHFMEECVSSFEDFEYDGSPIITVNDFWQILPAEAAETVAAELYRYASTRDEFTMGELKA